MAKRYKRIWLWIFGAGTLTIIVVLGIFFMYTQTPITKERLESPEFHLEIDKKIRSLTGLNFKFKEIISDEDLNFTIEEPQLSGDSPSSPICEIDKISGKLNSSLLYFDIKWMKIENPRCQVSVNESGQLLGISSDYQFSLEDIGLVFGAKIDSLSLEDMKLSVHIMKNQTRLQTLHIEPVSPTGSMDFNLKGWKIEGDLQSQEEIIVRRIFSQQDKKEELIKFKGKINIQTNNKGQDQFSIDLQFVEQTIIPSLSAKPDARLKISAKRADDQKFLLEHFLLSHAQLGEVNFAGQLNFSQVFHKAKLDLNKIHAVLKTNNDFFSDGFQYKQFKFSAKQATLEGEFQADSSIRLSLNTKDSAKIGLLHRQSEAEQYLESTIQSTLKIFQDARSTGSLNLVILEQNIFPAFDTKNFPVKVSLEAQSSGVNRMSLSHLNVEIKDLLHAEGTGELAYQKEKFLLSMKNFKFHTKKDLQTLLNLPAKNLSLINFEDSQFSLQYSPGSQNDLKLQLQIPKFNLSFTNNDLLSLNQLKTTLQFNLKLGYGNLPFQMKLDFQQASYPAQQIKAPPHSLFVKGRLQNSRELYLDDLNLVNKSKNTHNQLSGRIVFDEKNSIFHLKGSINQDLSVFKWQNMDLTGRLSGPFTLDTREGLGVELSSHFSAKFPKLNHPRIQAENVTLSFPTKAILSSDIPAETLYNLNKDYLLNLFFKNFRLFQTNLELKAENLLYKNLVSSEYRLIKIPQFYLKKTYRYETGKDPKINGSYALGKIFVGNSYENFKELLDISMEGSWGQVKIGDKHVEFDFSTDVRLPSSDKKDLHLQSHIILDRKELENFSVQEMNFEKLLLKYDHLGQLSANANLNILKDASKFHLKLFNPSLHLEVNQKFVTKSIVKNIFNLKTKEILVEGFFSEDNNQFHANIRLPYKKTFSKAKDGKRSEYFIDSFGNLDVTVRKNLSSTFKIDYTLNDQNIFPTFDTKSHPLTSKITLNTQGLNRVDIANIQVSIPHMLDLKGSGSAEYQVDKQRFVTVLEEFKLSLDQDVRKLIGFHETDKPLLEIHGGKLQSIIDFRRNLPYDLTTEYTFPETTLFFSQDKGMTLKNFHLLTKLKVQQNAKNIPFDLRASVQEINYDDFNIFIKNQNVTAIGQFLNGKDLHFDKLAFLNHENIHQSYIQGDIIFDGISSRFDLKGEFAQKLDALSFLDTKIEGTVSSPVSIQSLPDNRLKVKLDIKGMLSKLKHPNLEAKNMVVKLPVEFLLSQGLSTELAYKLTPKKILEEYVSSFDSVVSSLSVQAKEIRFASDAPLLESRNIITLPNLIASGIYHYDPKSGIHFSGDYQLDHLSAPRADGKGEHAFDVILKGHWENLKSNLPGIRLTADLTNLTSQTALSFKSDWFLNGKNLDINYQADGPILSFISSAGISKLALKDKNMHVDGTLSMKKFYRPIDGNTWNLHMFNLPFTGNIDGKSQVNITGFSSHVYEETKLQIASIDLSIHHKGHTNTQEFKGQAQAKEVVIETDGIGVFTAVHSHAKISGKSSFPLPADTAHLSLDGKIANLFSQTSNQAKTSLGKHDIRLKLSLQNKSKKVVIKSFELYNAAGKKLEFKKPEKTGH